MAKRDYYDVLGVTKGASEDDLKKAYRKLAKELHPDRNKDDPGSESRFKEVNEAYDVLRDGTKRAAYDRYGHAAFGDGGMGAGAAGAARGRGPQDFGSAFSDIFDDLFGDFMGRRAGGGPGARGRGSDLRYNLTIDLEDAFAGKTVTIKAPGAVVCDSCSGTGAEGGAQPTTCPTCSGLGKVRAQQGLFTIERTCPTCGGRGKIVKTPCRACSGAGKQQRERALSVQVPQGVEDGTRIRLAGEGEPGAFGGQAGDLYIFVSVRAHDVFKRDGADLLCEVTIPFLDAALGGAIEAPTLDGGRTKVAIPAGTSTGKQLRLRGKGMPTMRGERVGDLYLDITVETPQNLTTRQKDLLKQLAREIGAGQQPDAEAFKARAEAFWKKGGK